MARRASLEDDLEALTRVSHIDFGDLLEPDVADAIKAVVERLAGLASGRLQILREMREMDDRLGLTPKSMAQLRWSIKAPEAEPVQSSPGLAAVSSIDDRWRRAASE